MAGLGEADFQRIDDVLADWQQGDCAVGEHWFLFRHEPSLPLTKDAAEAAEDDADAAESEVRGLMVVSQTCERSSRPKGDSTPSTRAATRRNCSSASL